MCPLDEASTGRFLVTGTIKLPRAEAGAAQLSLPGNGHTLVAETQGGATFVEL